MTYQSSSAKRRPADNHPWRNSGLPASPPPPLYIPNPPKVPSQRESMVPRHWWSVGRAASELGVSDATVNRLCREGKLVGKVVPGLPGGRAGAGVRKVEPASVRACRIARQQRREEIERNRPNRVNAGNHGWPIAEYHRKLRGEA